MKKITASIIVFTLLFSSVSIAQDYKTSLGIRLSTRDAVVNNSLSFKHFLNSTAAIEALFTIDPKVAIGALYEIHKDIPSAEGLTWFYGGGAYIGFDSDKSNPSRSLAGAQGIVGLDYKFPYIPINLTLDWKPELNLIDNINFEPAAIGISIRFVFK
jgi:hypothetical protein